MTTIKTVAYLIVAAGLLATGYVMYAYHAIYYCWPIGPNGVC